MVALGAQEAKKFAYQAPKTGAGLFDDKLGMLEREREEYATNLANHAAARVMAHAASAASLTEARRLLALSLHLSPRNKKALVVNYQLTRGLMPKVEAGEYSPEVLARLLLTRAQLLGKQGGPQNQLLARCFVELAAEFDPSNEDAIYEQELQRIDHGAVDWSVVTDTKSPEPEEDPKAEAAPAPAPSPAPARAPAAAPTPERGKTPPAGTGPRPPFRGRPGA
jgi:hypothetical protein